MPARFTYFALYDTSRRTVLLKDHSDVGWCTRDKKYAEIIAAHRGLVALPVQIWQDHREAIRACNTNAEVEALIANVGAA